jgi:8-hydroxy-5-deazaflavin:NADPH oxidoreductase
MKIGIIGAGNVGGTLGKRWTAKGHSVAFASTDPSSEKMQKLLSAAGKGATAGDNKTVATTSDVLVFATPWAATEAAIAACGDLSGKIVVDTTNPVAADFSGLSIGHTDSAGEQVQRWAKGARVVKAFNTVGFNIMADPQIEGRRAVMYVAGDDPDARKTVAGLAEEIGFEPIEANGITSARVLEPFAMLWIFSAYKFGFGRDFAFSIIRKKGAR